MGIKGKRKSRGGARFESPAPKPKIERRRTPLLRRRWVRRGGAGLLVALAVWGGLFTWGRVSRADRLRAYESQLRGALAPYARYTAPEGGDPQLSMTGVVQAFLQGQLTPQRLEDVATKIWEKQFGDARDAVRKLRPPDELRTANGVIAQGIDLSIGAARLWVAVAKQRALAEATKDKALRKRLEGQVQLLFQNADEYQRERAEPTLRLGLQAVEDLKRAWGVATAAG